jgi:hypothetical protein
MTQNEETDIENDNENEQLFKRTIWTDKEWDDIQIQFDSYKNIDELFRFISGLIIRAKVCTNAECPMFKSRRDLDHDRRALTFKTLQDAQNNIKNDLEYQNYEHDFKVFIEKCADVFHDLYTLKGKHDTLFWEQENLHRRKKEMMKIAAKARMISPEFQTETQNYVDDTDKVADVYDNIVQAKRNATKAKLQADAKGGKKAGV